MRQTKPSNNKFYLTKGKGGYSQCIQGKVKSTGKPDPTADVLANCVGYACGRFNEIIGSMKYPTFYNNAENFIEKAISLGLSVVKEPTLGGIMVFQKGTTLKGSDGAGHVMVVEKIIDKDTIYTSESAWNGASFFNATRKRGNGKWGMSTSYKYRGCIVNPKIGYKPFEPTKTIDKIAKEVIKGVYGNQPERQKKLEAEGYNYSEVQAKVNELLKPKTEVWKPKVGDIVVPIKKENYKGKKLIQWDNSYEILKIDNRGAVLGAVRGTQRPVWAVLKLNNLRRK
jgi:surface antigen